MKRFRLLIYLLGLPSLSMGQQYSATENYIVEKIYLDPTNSGHTSRVINNVTYFDGFGRKLQEIQVGSSPGGTSDIILPHVYGKFGQVEKEYLPYNKSGNNGAFDPNAMSTSNWNIYGTTEAPHAFSRTDYDDSPLNRILKKTGPGKNWHTTGGGKGVSSTYGTNTGNEVRLYRVSSSGNLIFNNAYYPAGSLQKATITDENGNKTETFTGKDNKIVLVVNVGNTQRLETYSVYDIRGLLRYVLPPEANARLQLPLNETVLQQFAYRYDYDARERMTVKKLPGCDPVYMVYDRRDRLVMSQDGKQRAESANKWSYSLYDNQNRVIESGEVISTITGHSNLQMEVAGKENHTPAGNRSPLQYTLYDTYNATTNVPVLAFRASEGYSDDYHKLVAGLVVSVRTKVLSAGIEKWLTTTTYYDDRCRVIQTVSENLLGQRSQVDIKYDFTGNIVQQRERHGITASQTDALESVNEYDNRGRLLSSTAKLNNGSPATVNYTYDAVGRLIKKKYGNVDETMAYNPRGWLTSKESVPFKMKLRYENPEGGAATCWNGNVSEWEWQHGSGTSLMYDFTYDEVNRLTETTQKQKNGTSWETLTGNYLEKGISYDLNGNIKTLKRTANGTLVDNLTYGYTGNQLTNLTEGIQTSPTGDVYSPEGVATGNYVYDKNGNMINDSRRTLNLSYNLLNLLSEVKTTSGVLKARYTYLADGTKLRVRDNGEVNGFDYLGSLTYRKSSAGLQLESANFSGGVIRINSSNSGGIEVNYFLTDHLGSVRAIVDGSGEVLERNDYYPFGAKHTRSEYAQQINNRYKYNGKEEQVTGNLNYLDYGARMYDGKLGRWFTIDPLLEKAINISPYAYCVNNPMKYIDPNGERINFYQNKKGVSTPVEFIDAFDEVTRYLWEMFAKTQAGFDFLSLYAEAGQSIGSVVFYEDGPFAGIDLNIYSFDDVEGVLGSFSIDLGKRKDNISFKIKMNRIDIYDKTELADYLVALGHEFFIHMEQWQRKYLSAFAKKDSKGLDHLIEVSSKEGGIYDHTRYINGNESYKSFTTYLQQLKSIKDSPLNPTLIDNAKKKHDEIYEEYRKVGK